MKDIIRIQIIEKYNPNHDKKGRFTTGGGSGIAGSAASKQKYQSAGTSLNQIPASFKKIEWKSGTVNFDNGGGKYDTATNFLKEKGVENLVYDPFNRSKSHNDGVIGRLGQQKADTSTIANVLNVIKEPEARKEVIQNSYNVLKDGGKCYIQVYSGSGAGEGKSTQGEKSYQNNKKIKDYIPEVESVFGTGNVQRKGEYLVATKKPFVNDALVGGNNDKTQSDIWRRQNQKQQTTYNNPTKETKTQPKPKEKVVFDSPDKDFQLYKSKSAIMDIEVIEKFNPYHDQKGRFTSGSGAASVSIGDKGQHTQAAIRAELKAVAPNGIGVTKIDKKDLGQFPKIGDSIAKHLDENGNLTPEREALHQQIMANFLSGLQKADGQAEFIMMGGGPASGKSSTINEGKVTIPDKRTTATIDPDAIKTMLPEYKEMLAKGDPNAAGYVHEESSALAKRINSVAQKNGYNVLYDGTGDGSVKSVEKKLAEAKANGLKTRGIYVTCPTDSAVERATARAQKTGRHVNEDVIRNTHKKVSQILPEVASQFDNGVELWDTSVRGNTRLVAKGGNGKGLTAVDQKLYDEFLAKASE